MSTNVVPALRLMYWNEVPGGRVYLCAPSATTWPSYGVMPTRLYMSRHAVWVALEKPLKPATNEISTRIN